MLKISELKAAHKRFLEEQKMNVNEFYFIESTLESYKFLHMPTMKIVDIRR